ncbi:EGF-containing fibulin-like extracellular matrix protein 1 [Salvelinus namaycush]|uniref:EGF-containing fibulin-like extracellular matrix protein 1 n=1 Tax=Salvelinus namaycush TaxID=8040 RepID=A0A8U0PC63_SALNM|nr:EGF-containing fibulin-like extracellular matrix protein 1 [Salvelinus namaycush]
MERQECKDINECTTVPDACKGGMRCINHFGGYFCLPQNAQIIVSNGDDEPTVAPLVEEQPPLAPAPALPIQRVIQSSFQSQGTMQCAAGFVVDELNYCRVSEEGDSGLMELVLLRFDVQVVLQEASQHYPDLGDVILQDVNECEGSNPCQHQCYNIMGSFICQCEQGYELTSNQASCQDIDECAFSSYMCQWQCVNQPGGYVCTCPEGYQLQGNRMCQDIDECETGNNCREDEMCWNYFGGFRCYPRNPCHEPYVKTGEGRCSCQSLTICRGLPPSIVYKYMSISSERSVPADIFQIQATSVYPNMHNTFRVKSGNEGGEFFLRRSSNVSAMLVMTKPLTGPREHVVDLEMVTHNNVLNYRSSSLLRLTIIVGPYAF